MFNTKFEFLNILKTKTIKMSRTVIVNFEMVYKIEFTCSIFTKHHVCKKDNRKEAASYEKHSVEDF